MWILYGALSRDWPVVATNGGMVGLLVVDTYFSGHATPGEERGFVLRGALIAERRV